MEPRTAIITGGEGDLAKAVREFLEADGWTVLALGRAELDVVSAESVKRVFQNILPKSCRVPIHSQTTESPSRSHTAR